MTRDIEMLETATETAKDALAPLGWRLENIDRMGRGSAVFASDDGVRLIFEIGLWWPPGAHPLDDEPGVILSCQEKGSPKVQVTYLSEDKQPDLFWSSSADDVKKQTLMIVRDFERSFLGSGRDRRTLYNRVLDLWLEKHGVVEKAVFRSIKDALASDQATSVAWAEQKLSILRKRVLGGCSILAFDPTAGRFSEIKSIGEFDAYVSANLRR